MSTLASAFTAKVRNLHDYESRIIHGTIPVPSGIDTANNVRYFSQILLTLLKDVPKSPYEMLPFPEKDSARMAMYASLDFKGLYTALVQLLDIAPIIQFGHREFGDELLQCLGCLMPFLEGEQLEGLPYLTASLLSVLPEYLHQDVINTLCFYIIPFTITRKYESREPAHQSVSGLIMIIFEFSKDTAHHCQVLECLMSIKLTLLKDLLCVIAYGTFAARASAAKLLFYYWPTFNSTLFERRGAPPRFTNDWVPFVCQREMCCQGNGRPKSSAEAAKVCFDPCVSITFATNKPPPLYLCIECANEIHREHPNQVFHDILHPLQQVSVSCENKGCRSSDKSVVALCFSTECASYNCYRPIRYCRQCHNSRHNNKRGGDHIIHTCLPSAWDMNPEMQTYLVESIVSLLKEARPTTPEVHKDMTEIQMKAAQFKEEMERSKAIPLEERQLMGRFGVWLLVGLCNPSPDTPTHVLGRLLSMLFHWFHVTAYSFDELGECTLERLKKDYVCEWMGNICKSHFDVYVSCLLPHPPEYAKVGGHWDMLVSRTSHLKNGLNRFFCLVPYTSFTLEIWDQVMPYWLEAIVKDVPEKELCELKLLLSKFLDPDLSILGVEAKKIYQFVAIRFKQTSPRVMEQTLSWLQILTILDIAIPLHLLFSFFEDGVTSMTEVSKRSSISPVMEDESAPDSPLSDDEGKSGKQSGVQFHTEVEMKVTNSVLMCDIILKQMELHRIEKHTGIHTVVSQDICRMLISMMSAPWMQFHVCTQRMDCPICEACIVWHQLSLELVEYVTQEHPAHPPDPPDEEVDIDDGTSKRSPPENEKKCASDNKPDVVMSIPNMMEMNTVGGILIMTATVETVVEQLDLAPILSHDRGSSIPTSTIPRSVTLSDGEDRKCRRSEHDTRLDPESNPEPLDDDVWQTSAGNFKFNLNELPQQLQFIHQILKDLPNIKDPNIMYFLLQSLHLFILHGDALNKAMKDHSHKGFVVWCQENLIIKNLWDLCNAEHSHICEVGVPILLHCVSLEYGSDAFWKIVQEEFHHTDWKVRFTAVERATVIARFMDSTPLKNDRMLQASLANVFCHLISSMDDISPYVAQRATLYLGTIHDTALKSLVMCLETQFDSVIIDRPMVIQSLYQLHNAVSDRKIISWEFFLARFDSLFIEAQINADRSADISYLRDLLNLDFTNEHFVKKVNRIQEALSTQSSDSHLAKTLSASFGHKWPYKRTMSAPASILPRQELSKDGQQAQSLNITEDTSFTNILTKVIENEQSDKETIHLLVFLLMQFLSRSEQAYPTDEKNTAKKQTIVLRHLYLLLGYNQIERLFQVSPSKLRMSPVFNAFISNLPQLFDQNNLMGIVMLPTSLLLLQYSPCPPHHIIADFQLHPNYSLWYLEPLARRSWLMSLLVLLYKYHYKEESFGPNIVALIKIVMNTLDAQHHVCRRIPPTVVMGGPPSRSRDVSQPSLGTVDRDMGDNSETPPPSPKQGAVDLRNTLKTSLESCWGDDHSVMPFSRLKKPAFSPEGNGSDVELAVIPEKENQDSEEEDVIHDNMSKKKSSGSIRPMWFPDSNDRNNEAKNEASSGGACASMFAKLGVREGVKMLVSSSLFSVASPTSPPQIKSPTTPPVSAQVIHKLQEKSSPKELTTPTVKEKHIPDLSVSSDIYPPWQISAVPKPTKNFVPPPTPSGERLTPGGLLKPGVGQVKSISPKTFHYDEPWGSPDSPLSRMDIHMLHSPMSSFDSYSQCEPSPTQSVTQLELPIQERLLPIGISSTNTNTTEGMKNLIQHITEALGVHEDGKKDDMSCSRTPTELESLSISPQTVTKQNSLDKPDIPQRSRSTSPRRLTKQLALDSPPQDTVDSKKLEAGKKQQKQQQNMFAMNHQERKLTSDSVDLDPSFQNACHSVPQLPKSTLRVGDECIFERCSECGTIREEYSDEELALCLIMIGTFVHREPELAAPMLPDILPILSKYASQPSYTWQTESKVHLPGGAVSVAHQFLRCILHQLAPHGIFFQTFQTFFPETSRTQFFRSLVQSLLDFNDLNPMAPLHILLENLNSRKSVSTEKLVTILDNIACYMDFLPIEAGLGPGAISWQSVLTQLETFFRNIISIISTFDNVTSFFRIMISILRVPAVTTCKGLLEPFSKILSFSIQYRQLKYQHLIDLCYLSNRGFTKEREKLMLTRVVVIELVQALKFKTTITCPNFFMLISFVLQDIGGVLPPTIAQDETLDISSTPYYTTGASECMKHHVQDVLDFLNELNISYKLKYIGVELNEDTVIGTLKSGIAQYVILEMARNNARDARSVSKYLPWLYNVQKETRDLSECLTHIRLLSWLLIGTLTQSCLQNTSCLPIPQETACYVADHIHTILSAYIDHVNSGTGFPMNTLYHVFILCQLWTVYMEHASSFNLPNTEAHALTMSILFDFWGKVTNDILTLLNVSKEVAAIVNFYFINLLETLYSCNASLLARLIPIWTPILFSHNLQLSMSLTVKLQECRNITPKAALSHQNINNNSILKWLRKLQFQLGQNECYQSQHDQDAMMYDGDSPIEQETDD
uniref:Protein unc-79 homolog n=1 Tax=Cacopsylla melanoneura TaxID=428564 RepID=A0A8D8RWG0_9HEMI